MKLKKPIPTSRVFLFYLIRDSENAYLVKRGKCNYWIPKSQIISMIETTMQKVSMDGEVYDKKRLQVELPMWLVEKNNKFKKTKATNDKTRTKEVY